MIAELTTQDHEFTRVEYSQEQNQKCLSTFLKNLSGDQQGQQKLLNFFSTGVERVKNAQEMKQKLEQEVLLFNVQAAKIQKDHHELEKMIEDLRLSDPEMATKCEQFKRNLH